MRFLSLFAKLVLYFIDQKRVVTISFFRTLLQAFIDPSTLWKATLLTKKKTIQLFLLLTLIISIPFFVAGYQSIRNMNMDAQTVEKRLPAFEIKEGGIVFEEPIDQAIVVRTNTMNLIVDVNNQYEDRLEQRDLENTQVGIVFKENHFLIHTAQIPIQISYENADGLTDQFFRSMLHRFSTVNFVMIVSIMFGSFIPGIIEAAFRYLIFSLAANVLAAFMRLRIPFSFNWRIMMVASVVPTLFFAFLNSFYIFPPAQLTILLGICLYMYRKGLISHFKNLN